MGKPINPAPPGFVHKHKRKLLERVIEMCAEQGVDPKATLNVDDVKAFMTMTHAEKNVLNLIATGYPVRNANAIIKVIELKLERSAPKQSSIGETQAVTVTINSLAPGVTATVEPQDLAEKLQ